MKKYIKYILWKLFGIRFDIHNLLKKKFKKIKLKKAPCKHKIISCDNISCLNYISCGPGFCDTPCPLCLFWTGYGLKYDINDKCKNKCIKDKYFTEKDWNKNK